MRRDSLDYNHIIVVVEEEDCYVGAEQDSFDCSNIVEEEDCCGGAQDSRGYNHILFAVGVFW